MKTYMLIFCIIMCGCTFTYENNTNNDAYLAQLKKETDSLKNEIRALKEIVANRDTLQHRTEPAHMHSPGSAIDTNSTLTIPAKKKTVPIRKIKPSARIRPTDTIIHFYKNTKKISVKISPRNAQQKSVIRFYDLKGKQTFEQVDVHSSYSVSTDIKEWHSNGAVKLIVVHLNPGASMYWYETVISFDTDNTPLWKEEITYPSKLQDMMDNKSYWDVIKKEWIKQNVVDEQPYVK